MKTSNTCETCRYFRSVNAEGGTCHLKPPQIFLIPVQTLKGASMSAAAFFPPVRVSDACGEHKPTLNG